MSKEGIFLRSCDTAFTSCNTFVLNLIIRKPVIGLLPAWLEICMHFFFSLALHLCFVLELVIGLSWLFIWSSSLLLLSVMHSCFTSRSCSSRNTKHARQLQWSLGHSLAVITAFCCRLACSSTEGDSLAYLTDCRGTQETELVRDFSLKQSVMVHHGHVHSSMTADSGIIYLQLMIRPLFADS